ncbi:unnamed protein product [Rangifer tarandus platyrhynchus]|uniref:Uncharacterized protein n=1 Tax=Rangifer tarandus platyrhynchus TaxID=3082113 RepID=A0ABN9A2A7_RANTA|nr:unnamed protein product [Rangifer tarandus platyrhynchus]
MRKRDTGVVGSGISPGGGGGIHKGPGEVTVSQNEKPSPPRRGRTVRPKRRWWTDEHDQEKPLTDRVLTMSKTLINCWQLKAVNVGIPLPLDGEVHVVSQEAAELLNPNVRLAGKGRATSKRRLITSPGRRQRGCGRAEHSGPGLRAAGPACLRLDTD